MESAARGHERTDAAQLGTAADLDLLGSLTSVPGSNSDEYECNLGVKPCAPGR